jgi:hypothetical protein
MEAPAKLTPYMEMQARYQARVDRLSARGGSVESARNLGVSIAVGSGTMRAISDRHDKWDNLTSHDTVIVLRVHPGEQDYVNRYASFSKPLCTGHPGSGKTYMLLPGDYVFSAKQEAWLYHIEGSHVKVKVEDLPTLMLI